MNDNWISVKDYLPDDFEDYEIKLSDGSEAVAYYSRHNGGVWCNCLAVPIIRSWDGDNRTVTHWEPI